MSKHRTSDELYAAAPRTRGLEAIASGNPQRIVRRVTNKILGHYLWRALRGVFR